jgi:hypothetical protein
MAGGGGGIAFEDSDGGFTPADETTLAPLLAAAGLGAGASPDGLAPPADVSALSADPSAGLAAFFFGGGFFDETTGASSLPLSADDASSSGGASRTRPSRSALRRRRSAWASTMLEEWLFTPMPRAPQRSMISLFERPNSLASS